MIIVSREEHQADARGTTPNPPAGTAQRGLKSEVNVFLETVGPINLLVPAAAFHAHRDVNVDFIDPYRRDLALVCAVKEINGAKEIKAGEYRPALFDVQ
jgi:hypothetical protein